MSMAEPWLDDEPDDPDCCHHGLGFDEYCEDCELEDEFEDAVIPSCDESG